MRLLVLGGTVFLGRWVVVEALTRGHEVTVLHRGRHGAGLFPQAETLIGDRDGDLAALAGRRWDAVVDTSGLLPGQVDASARLLADAVEHYVLASSVAVYRDWPERAIGGEDAPLRDDVDDEHGALKAACERALRAVLPGRAACVRAAALVGPHEYFGRLTWWLGRMARGGSVLAPGPAGAPLQVADARDVAAFMLDLAERRVGGAFNVGTPPGAAAWGELLEACREVAGAGAQLAWVDGERLLTMLDDPLGDLPLWPIPHPAAAGLYDVGVARAAAAGMRSRPLAETVADTWEALTFAGEPEYLAEARTDGLDARREAVVLAALA